MSRQWFIPSGVMPFSAVMIDEDGIDEYFIPALGMFNEDTPAVVVGGDDGVGSVAAKYRTYGWLGRLRR